MSFNFITSLFDLLSLYYIYRALRIAYETWRDRARLGSNPLTPEQQRRAEEAAFFLAIPPGVAVHEFGHALAIWLSGGQVVQFGYRVFWGFVVPTGTFTAAQDWVIAVAGTIGTLIYGLALWLWFRTRRTSSLRFFGLRAMRLHIFYALIYYPVFSAMGLFGDWVTIYNFRATPLLSGMTAVVHAGILLAYWRLSRRGFFEMPHFANVAAQDRLHALQTEAQAQPHDAAAQLRLVQALIQTGTPRQAERALDAFLAQHPDSAAGWLEKATLQAVGKRHIPSQAATSAEKALQMGLSDPHGVRRANYLIGLRYLDMGKPAESLRYLDRAVAVVESEGMEPNPHFHTLYQMRARARRQLRQPQGALADVEKAIALARQVEQTEAVRSYEELREAIRRDAGNPK